MVVEEIMSVRPFSVDVRESVGRVIGKLREADVRHIPVVEEGMLVGIVSDRDLGSLPLGLTEAGPTPEASRLLAQPISTLMSSDVVSVNPQSEVAEVIDLMVEHKIGAVPVVEADSLRLVGIVSYVDILRAARDEL